MRWLIDSSRLSLAVVAVLVGLLAVLATLQYRWIAQLSEAERARLQEDIDQSAAGFAEAFDTEIARAFGVFKTGQPGHDAELARLLADRLAEWRLIAEWPDMVNELIIVRGQGIDELQILCFDGTSQTLLPCDRDRDLVKIRNHLHAPVPGVPVIDGGLPGLVLAMDVQPGDRIAQPFDWQPPRDHLVVWFDREYIGTEILPALAETHFGVDGEVPYLLRVTADGPGRVIFETGPNRQPWKGNPDATERLLGLRPHPETDGLPTDARRGKRPPHPERRPVGTGRPPQRRQPPPGLRAHTEDGRWVLSVRHPGGSLEEVVAKARRRNMAISAVTLIMLGLTAALVVASTRRARQLARQQMDFVAAVSHELRTPLTAIRSAGQNLADGIIDDPSGVRKYGLLIEREGRRLTEMIGRVLTFAGIRSGRQIYRMKPVDVGGIVRATLQDSSWVLGESGFEVESEIANDLPMVIGDEVALRQVVTNLIDNALKYAADGRWLGVHVDFKPGSGDGAVRLSVSDHGQGIPKKEQAAVFEPFARGATAGSNVPGSGLGLAVVRSIVKAHGGAIDVASSPEGGAVFTVRLPAAPEKGEQS